MKANDYLAQYILSIPEKGSVSTTKNSFLREVLSSLPIAVASPVLEYSKDKRTAEILEKLIDAKSLERHDILITLQYLAKYNMLTSDIAQLLLIAYIQQPY